MDRPQVRMRFKVIELLSKTLSHRPKDAFIGDNFNFDINVEMQVNPQEKLIISVVNVAIRELNKKDVLGSISVGCAFLIENFEQVIAQDDKGVFQIPLEADFIIKTMAISTARGIIFSEFKGTFLYNAILPIVFLPAPVPKVEVQKMEIEIPKEEKVEKV